MKYSLLFLSQQVLHSVGLFGSLLIIWEQQVPSRSQLSFFCQSPHSQCTPSVCVRLTGAALVFPFSSPTQTPVTHGPCGCWWLVPICLCFGIFNQFHSKCRHGILGFSMLFLSFYVKICCYHLLDFPRPPVPNDNCQVSEQIRMLEIVRQQFLQVFVPIDNWGS